MCSGTRIQVSMETCEVPERMRLQSTVLILGLRGITVLWCSRGLRDCWEPLTQACISLFSSARSNYGDIQRPQTSMREKKIHVCLHVLRSWNTLSSTLSFNQKTFDELVVPSPHICGYLRASQKFSMGTDEHVSCMMEENVTNFITLITLGYLNVILASDSYKSLSK